MKNNERGKFDPKNMQEELTADMHAEFMDGEMTPLQMKCFAVWCRIDDSEDHAVLDAALRYYRISKDDYLANIDAALQA